MGVRGLSGQDLAALALSRATRTPAASDSTTRKSAAEPAAPRVARQPDATVLAVQAKAEEVEAMRDAQARQEQAARRADALPVLARHDMRLRVDEATERIVAQFVDETNNVIKQIPPQELLEIAARFRRLTGLLFDRDF